MLEAKPQICCSEVKLYYVAVLKLREVYGKPHQKGFFLRSLRELARRTWCTAAKHSRGNTGNLFFTSHFSVFATINQTNSTSLPQLSPFYTIFPTKYHGNQLAKDNSTPLSCQGWQEEGSFRDGSYLPAQ